MSQEFIEQWAGHCQEGSSNKVYGIGLFRDGDRGIVRACWGPFGASLNPGEWTDSFDKAKKLYDSKKKDKEGKGYAAATFAAVGITPFGAIDSTVVAPPTSTAPAKEASFPYVAAHVMPLSEAQLAEAIASPAQGVSEKVNGERTFIYSDGQTLTAFNRRGQVVSTVPEAAQCLSALGCSFVIDGERMTRDDAGSYVAFDLLMLGGEDLRERAYSERIVTLGAALGGAGLVDGVKAEYTPSGAPQLALLVAETDHLLGLQVVQRIKAKGGEGIIVRSMHAPYEGGDTRHIRKFKYQSEIDCFVIGVKAGLATGSVELGLVRETDGAVISVGSVRSGLRDQDIRRLEAMLAQGERPVLTIQYLPIRSVGTQLVEPKTDIGSLRADKPWGECLTSQLGPEKSGLVAAAPIAVRV